MVEVFKTDVQKVSQAKKIIALLLEHFPDNRINFDLSDCDRVLRIEGDEFDADRIITLVTAHGFACNVLD